MAAKSLSTYFDPQVLGASLKEVTTGVQKRDNQVISRWFHSAKEADLFIWMDKENSIIKQQLSYFGEVVEWNVVEGVKTGHVVIDEDGRNRGSDIIQFDDLPQTTDIRQAIALLECVTALNAKERKALIVNFRKLGASKTMSSEDFIARFGDYLGKPVAVPAVSRWGSLLAIFSRWFKR
jgi:hypothetical protein